MSSLSSFSPPHEKATCRPSGEKAGEDSMPLNEVSDSTRGEGAAGVRAVHRLQPSAPRIAAAIDMPRAHQRPLRVAPADDRFHNGLSVGPMDVPQAAGAVYAVTHVDVIPPQRENAVAALKVLGDANRGAGGSVRYELVQQTNRPNHCTVFEVWRSREAFDANTMSAHQRDFRDKLAQMTGALYDERLYEILN